MRRGAVLPLPGALGTIRPEMTAELSNMSGPGDGAPISDRERGVYAEDGFLVVENVVAAAELEEYREIVDRMVEGRIDCGDSRADLGGHRARVRTSVENITMLPSETAPQLAESTFFRRSLDIARALLGEDLERDMTC